MMLPFVVRVFHTDENNERHCLSFDSFEQSERVITITTNRKEKFFLYKGCLNQDRANLAACESLDPESEFFASYYRIAKTKTWTLFFDHEDGQIVFNTIDYEKFDVFETETFKVFGETGETGKPVVTIMFKP